MYTFAPSQASQLPSSACQSELDLLLARWQQIALPLAPPCPSAVTVLRPRTRPGAEYYRQSGILPGRAVSALSVSLNLTVQPQPPLLIRQSPGQHSFRTLSQGNTLFYSCPVNTRTAQLLQLLRIRDPSSTET